MKGETMLKPIAIATLVAGTLDILFAIALTVLFGREIGTMLRYVASGPFPAATGMGAAGALLGLLVHFALMAVMAAVFVIVAREQPRLLDRPLLSGLLYGLATYVVMNWIVVPVRFDTSLPPSLLSIATQLFAHIVLVGLPIALVAARYLRPRTA
jgi:membrane associated rhomboid family serine protease